MAKETVIRQCFASKYSFTCTLDYGHEGDHLEASKMDGFVYATWANNTEGVILNPHQPKPRLQLIALPRRAVS